MAIEPGPHWWEASALTTAPSLHPQKSQESRNWSGPCLLLVWGHRRLWPQPFPLPQTKNVLAHLQKHDTHSLHGQKCVVRNSFLTGPYPIFLPRRRALKRSSHYYLTIYLTTFWFFNGFLNHDLFFQFKTILSGLDSNWDTIIFKYKHSCGFDEHWVTCFKHRHQSSWVW